MRERRALKRRYVKCYARVFDRHTGALVGQVENITPAGVKLTSEIPPAQDEILRLRLELPEDTAPERHVHFDAQCLWCKPAFPPHFYSLGCHMLNISPEKAAAIDHWAEQYGV